MTRKDYVLIAKALKAQMKLSETFKEEDGMTSVANIARDLSDSFAIENPRFDRARFLSACGVM